MIKAMKFFKIIITCFLLLSSFLLKAGNEELNSNKVWVMGLPQYLFQNGIRLEIDKQLENPHNWITVSPTIYYKDKPGLFGNRNVKSMSGAGLDLIFRWYPYGIRKKGGMYLAAGGGYRYIAQKNSGSLWETYTENNQTYIRYVDILWNKQIHTGNIRGTFGFQMLPAKNFAIDIYCGFALKMSEVKTPEGFWHYQDSYDFYEFGYTGMMILGGIRFGIGW
jgi:hypothetical protein